VHFFVLVSSLTVNDVFFPDAATDSTFVVLIYHEEPIPKSFVFVLSLAVLHVFFLDRLTDNMFVYSIYQGESNPQLFSLVLSLTVSELAFSDKPFYRISTDLSCHKIQKPLHLPNVPLLCYLNMAPYPNHLFHSTIVLISSSMDRQNSDDIFHIAGNHLPLLAYTVPLAAQDCLSPSKT
jgi:hypothetical protein